MEYQANERDEHFHVGLPGWETIKAADWAFAIGDSSAQFSRPATLEPGDLPAAELLIIQMDSQAGQEPICAPGNIFRGVRPAIRMSVIMGWCLVVVHCWRRN